MSSLKSSYFIFNQYLFIKIQLTQNTIHFQNVIYRNYNIIILSKYSNSKLYKYQVFHFNSM